MIKDKTINPERVVKHIYHSIRDIDNKLFMIKCIQKANDFYFCCIKHEERKRK